MDGLRPGSVQPAHLLGAGAMLGCAWQIVACFHDYAADATRWSSRDRIQELRKGAAWEAVYLERGPAPALWDKRARKRPPSMHVSSVVHRDHLVWSAQTPPAL